MIFITVGTHEQPFDRLISYVDRLVEEGKIREKVFAQTGYCRYKPRNFAWKEFLPFEEIIASIKASSVVITHGGPASIMLALAYGRVPVVVPRQRRYGEHVDDHQVVFAKKLKEVGRAVAVMEMDELLQAIEKARCLSASMEMDLEEKARKFAERLDALCRELL